MVDVPDSRHRPAVLDRTAGPSNERAFRDALGLFATGVAVVTTITVDGRKLGLTVNSFTSVSLDPPLISINLAKQLRSIQDWLAADSFAVNLLSENQEAVSSGFARSQSDKWACAECVQGKTSNPILRTKLAAFECQKYACHAVGDHYILIGRVVHFEIERDAFPLLFYSGRYRKLGGTICR